MGEFVKVTEAAAVPVGELAAFDVGGTPVAVANVGGTLYAFDDTCTHLHCSLAEGSLDGTVVTCPCHRSQFDVTTGEVLRGPAKRPCEATPCTWRTTIFGYRADPGTRLFVSVSVATRRRRSAMCRRALYAIARLSADRDR